MSNLNETNQQFNEMYAERQKIPVVKQTMRLYPIPSKNIRQTLFAEVFAWGANGELVEVTAFPCGFHMSSYEDKSYYGNQQKTQEAAENTEPLDVEKLTKILAPYRIKVLIKQI